MMHHDHTIVTLVGSDSNRAGSTGTFREYGHTRNGQHSSSRVVMPFGSEYAIQFKFQDQVRRRLELRIDGTLVTDNLIISGSASLERFVDSAKRFKFVEANHTAVADPTSSQNGLIEITLWREVPQPILTTFNEELWHRPIYRGWNPPSGSYSGAVVMCSAQVSSPKMSLGPQGSVGPQGLPGATVEGRVSNQHFGTTEWRGDMGDPQTFTFKVEGKAVTEPQKKSFCASCGVKLSPKDNFCSTCGARV